MTIDEAIAYERGIADERKVLATKFEAVDNINMCLEYAEEHEQLAEWLEELKTYRECNICEYNKAIDDFAILIKETLNHDWATTKISEQIIYNRLFDKCNEIAEQLRKCKVDESTD